MTGPEYDAEFEAFLKRRSPMHRRLSDIDHAEPSVELDRLVLTRAREAIDTPSQPPLFRSTRWALPVGLAATILIAFTVVLNVDRHAARGVASSVSPAAEARAPAVARAASVRESAERAESPRVLSDSAPRDAVTEKKAVAPAVLAKRKATAESADVADASANSSQLVASSGAVSSPLRTQQAPALTASARSGASLAPAMAPPPPPPSAAAPAAPSPEGVADPHANADSWLREINRLRAAGRTTEADRELAAFREAYPTHPAYSVAKPPAR